MAVKKPTVGRRAMNALKDHYRANGTLLNVTDVVDFLGQRGITTHITQAREWDNSARKELARDELHPVSFPGRQNGYKRVGKPTPDERWNSVKSRVRYVTTASTTVSNFMQAAAAQPDATSKELAAAKMAESVKFGQEALKLLTDS